MIGRTGRASACRKRHCRQHGPGRRSNGQVEVAVPPAVSVAVEVPPVATSMARSVTTCDTAELVTVRKLESPAYTAVIACVPAVRLAVT